MLALLTAVALPMCHFVVATDAPSPQAIYIHEQAHCWGWKHKKHVGARGEGYVAEMPTGKWLKPYPNLAPPYYDTMREIRKICGKDEPFGCMWFD